MAGNAFFSTNDARSGERKRSQSGGAASKPVTTTNPLGNRRTALLQKKCAKCSAQDDASMLQLSPLATPKGIAPPSGNIQAKLKIGQAGDRFEKEADDVAERVVQKAEPAIQKHDAGGEKTNQPLASAEHSLQRQMEDDEDVTIQTKPKPSGVNAPPGPIESQLAGLQGSGRRLGREPRNYFEPRLRANFSQVRVHHDGASAALADSLNARAFTWGKNIVFGNGEYAPGTQAGKKLLAHELTHVMQPDPSVNSPLPAQQIDVHPQTAGARRLHTPSLPGQGRPLPQGERRFFEQRMSADFSDVRLHTGSAAEAMATGINARAFTLGSDVVFGKNAYSPGTLNGRRLLAHELTHVIQQSPVPHGFISQRGQPAVQRQNDEQSDERIQAIKEKLRRGEELTEAELEYIKQHVGDEIVRQLFGGGPQIQIQFDSSQPPQDVDRRYHARLDLQLSGLIGATAGSLEGTATADVDFTASVDEQRGEITIGPPTESNRMAALIRQYLFPNGNPRTFDFELSGDQIRWINAISLLAPISIVITGPDTEGTGGIHIRHESVPAGVRVVATLSPAMRTTSVEETERELPNDHWTLVPDPSVFATIGYANSLGSGAFGGTVGADFPLLFDTTFPLAYAGLGLRGSFDTNRFGRIGGTAFVGLNLNPLMLHLGFGTGAAFLPEAIDTPDGPAQTVLYTEAEGSIGYRILNNLELRALLTFGSGKHLPPFGSVQAGAGFVW